MADENVVINENIVADENAVTDENIMADENIVIDVDHVTVRFNMASQSVNNLKEYIIKLAKRELMFQEFLALKDLDLKVRAGEAWGIIGRNGAGKSTLLKLICGILKPYKGTVRVQGSVAPLIELGAGFDGELTAEENVLLNGTLMGYSEKFMKERMDEILTFAELKDFLDMPIKNYSSGMAAVSYTHLTLPTKRTRCF